MNSMNVDDAVQVTENIYWIGYADEKAHLHCNPCMFRFISLTADIRVRLLKPEASFWIACE